MSGPDWRMVAIAVGVYVAGQLLKIGARAYQAHTRNTPDPDDDKIGDAVVEAVERKEEDDAL